MTDNATPKWGESSEKKPAAGARQVDQAFPDSSSDDTAIDLFYDTYWSMLQVIAWVTTRDPRLVHMASDHFKGTQSHFQELTQPSGKQIRKVPSGRINWLYITAYAEHRAMAEGSSAPATEAVEREIARALESGRLTVRGIENGSARPVTISAEDWAYLKLLDFHLLGICARRIRTPPVLGFQFSGLKVRRDEVLAEWHARIPYPPPPVGRDGVISFPAGTKYWPVANLPDLIAQALSPDGIGQLTVIRDHLAAINRARQLNQLISVSPTTRLQVDHYHGDAEVSVEDIEKYVSRYGISVQLALRESPIETTPRVAATTDQTAQDDVTEDVAENALDEDPDSTRPIQDADEEIANLFDPVGANELSKMFPPSKGKWATWVDQASANGLSGAKRGRAMFNPYLAALWWLRRKKPEGWDLARCKRVLVNNLPPRSQDEKWRLTGEI